MDTNQLINGIGAAVAAAKPAQEYCFLWSEWWPMCMTKSEWSSWVQAFAVIFALALPWILNKRSRIRSLKSALLFVDQFRKSLGNLIWSVHHFEKDGLFQSYTEIILSVENIKEIKLRPEFLTSLSKFDSDLTHKLLLAVDELSEAKAQIKHYADEKIGVNPQSVQGIAFRILSGILNDLRTIQAELDYLEYFIHPKSIYGSLSIRKKFLYLKDRCIFYIKC